MKETDQVATVEQQETMITTLAHLFLWGDKQAGKDLEAFGIQENDLLDFVENARRESEVH
jgi:hypothetical protein